MKKSMIHADNKKSLSPKPKRRRKYGDITADEIVSTALTIVERDGASRLSMRTLAAELKISTMAIYYYIPNKDALVALILDRIYSGVTVRDTSGTTEERLHQFFWKCVNAVRKFPGVALLVGTG